MTDETVIKEYIEAITGKRDALQTQGVTSAELPRYVTGLYNLRDAVLLGIPVVFAILRSTTLPSVVELARHYDMLKGRVHKEIVFVGDSITTRAAERLVRRRIPHIVAGRQLFLPFLLLDIKSTGALLKDVELPEATKLGQWSEALVIRQLIHKDLDGISGAEIARKTGMSIMTAQRAVSQLTSANLCRLEERGRKKILHFDDVHSLWEKAAKILLPPLSMTLALDEIPKGLPTFVAGTSALAKSTLLAEDEIPVFATSRRNYARVARTGQVPLEDAKFRLELWDRDPALTAEDGVVDPISLYLNMRHGDDRVRIALADLLRRLDLGEPS
jgi:hypothetical protein